MTAADDDDTARADIGIVCALPLEAQEFMKRCERVRSYTGGDFVFKGGRYDGIRIVLVESGTGQARARRAVQALDDAHHPKWILSCGFAGALQAGVKVGQILVPNRFVTPEQPEIHVEVSMPHQPDRGLHVGSLLTVEHIVHTVAEKKTLGEQFQSVGVDMESYTIAEYCKSQHKRFFAVRVFSDDMSADLPKEVLSLMGPTGAVRMGAVLGALWNRPSSAQDMWKLREQAISASEHLANFLDGVVKQLHAAQ
ncbi:MAG: 5'-methylthioadenosine nucleosidase [Planctomycetaceae bacterium]|nr:5'-methylthioadenosine nucleosidase [Planctomycetaceae bacterium]